jgi:hypothetical protein
MKSNNSINTSRGQKESVITQFARLRSKEQPRPSSKKEEKGKEETKTEKKVAKVMIETKQKKKKVVSTPTKKV